MLETRLGRSSRTSNSLSPAPVCRTPRRWGVVANYPIAMVFVIVEANNVQAWLFSILQLFVFPLSGGDAIVYFADGGSTPTFIESVHHPCFCIFKLWQTHLPYPLLRFMSLIGFAISDSFFCRSPMLPRRPLHSTSVFRST